jgi:hypothetical protein
MLRRSSLPNSSMRYYQLDVILAARCDIKSGFKSIARASARQGRPRSIGVRCRPRGAPEVSRTVCCGPPGASPHRLEKQLPAPQSLFVGPTSCVAVACRAKEIQQRILAAIVGADASQPRPAAGSSVRPQHRAAQYGTVEVSVTSLRARARVSMSQTSLARGQLRSNMQGVCPRVTARHGVLRRQRSDADAARRPKLAAAE